MQKKIYTIVPFGGSGVGKSTVCNFLLNGNKKQVFKASDTTETSETLEVTSHEGWALGKPELKKKVKIFDVPGICSPDVPIEEWAETIRDGIPEGQNIDMAIMVLKCTDARMSVEQVAAAVAMRRFLEGLEPENTFICFTYCDTKAATESFFKKKLESIKRYCKLEVPEENIIKFSNSIESLEDFVEKFVEGEITVAEDLDVVVKEFDNDVMGSATEIDKREKMHLLSQLEAMRELLEEIREQKAPMFFLNRKGDEDSDDYDDSANDSTAVST